jgi:predicted alpha/beta-fold hydrolase
MIQTSDFNPPWHLRNPHLQTILTNILHPAIPEVTNETVELDDGDRITLAHGTSRGERTVLILHGLEGSLNSSYAQRVMHQLNEHGIPAAFFYFRGCDGQPNKKPRSYHSGDTGDLRQVIDHLKRTGSKEIALVGYSLGGNVTLKYMGEGQADEAISCACAVSVPLLLDVCSRRMDQGFSRLYQYTLLRRLKRKVEQKQAMLEEAGLSTNNSTLKNFYQFDDASTAPLHGFENAQDYYLKSSSRQFLPNIRKPTLIIHAKDDPFMTSEVLPAADEIPEAVHFELAKYGGHVGFIEGGLFKPRYWLEPRILKFLKGHDFC